jgi:hypothetical protein
MSLPQNYEVLGCLHLDITVADLQDQSINLPWKYLENLKFLLEAETLRPNIGFTDHIMSAMA